MATKKGSEVDNPEDSLQEVNLGAVVNAEVILAVMKILLWDEERALVSKMNENRNYVSTPVDSPLRAGRAAGRPGKIWA